jgi:hypothetical protein
VVIVARKLAALEVCLALLCVIGCAATGNDQKPSDGSDLWLDGSAKCPEEVARAAIALVNSSEGRHRMIAKVADAREDRSGTSWNVYFKMKPEYSLNLYGLHKTAPQLFQVDVKKSDLSASFPEQR